MGINRTYEVQRFDLDLDEEVGQCDHCDTGISGGDDVVCAECFENEQELRQTAERRLNSVYSALGLNAEEMSAKSQTEFEEAIKSKATGGESYKKLAKVVGEALYGENPQIFGGSTEDEACEDAKRFIALGAFGMKVRDYFGRPAEDEKAGITDHEEATIKRIMLWEKAYEVLSSLRNSFNGLKALIGEPQ